MLERARRDATMKILTWNVNGRVDEACSRQLDCVLTVEPDVLALQEVTLAS
jgi:exonuclease III